MAEKLNSEPAPTAHPGSFLENGRASTSNANASGDTTDIEKNEEDAQVATSSAAVTEEDPHPVKGIKWWLLLVAIYSTTFLYGLDNTIVADVQGYILDRFGEIEKLSWIGTGFPLGSVLVILPL
jgi:hypothetical protein